MALEKEPAVVKWVSNHTWPGRKSLTMHVMGVVAGVVR